MVVNDFFITGINIREFVSASGKEIIAVITMVHDVMMRIGILCLNCTPTFKHF